MFVAAVCVYGTKMLATAHTPPPNFTSLAQIHSEDLHKHVCFAVGAYSLDKHSHSLCWELEIKDVDAQWKECVYYSCLVC